MKIIPQPEYALLDSGDKQKLEKYGDFVLVRPDPQAIWAKKIPEKDWQKADAIFSMSNKGLEGEDKGHWQIKNKNIPAIAKEKKEYAWPIKLGPINIHARLTAFKHTGIFPEQLANWTWIETILKNNSVNKKITKTDSKNSADVLADTQIGQKPKILNLFGYSGGASVVAALGGAEVTHVDASRSALTWAKENMLLNNLDENAIRWILDDAVSFVKKELRRGNKYDAIMMDPPIFGRGAKGEVWKIEEHLKPLVDMCIDLLSEKPLFFILNGYAAGYSAISYENLLENLSSKFGGSVESGELIIEDIQRRGLPSGIVARWKKA